MAVGVAKTEAATVAAKDINGYKREQQASGYHPFHRPLGPERKKVGHSYRLLPLYTEIHLLRSTWRRQ